MVEMNSTMHGARTISASATIRHADLGTGLSLLPKAKQIHERRLLHVSVVIGVRMLRRNPRWHAGSSPQVISSKIQESRIHDPFSSELGARLMFSFPH